MMPDESFTAADHAFMARALQLAERGLYTTSPNPRVGCVLVRENQVIGEGWHVRAGEAHAEIHALQAARAAGTDCRGATAYVTLEPCSHFGRTPPCADALIAAGVGRVVAAMTDPNPLVAGQGLARLQAAGIVTAAGLLAEAAQALNPGFISRMQRGRPWVRLKTASSLDGQTALDNGRSQWITGPAARQDGQRWRARACALLTGIGTVLADNPLLNVRGVHDGHGETAVRQPLRIILDPRLETPPEARILNGTGGAVCIVTGMTADPDRAAALQAGGAEILRLAGHAAGHVDLAELLQHLGQRGINELHVEAGARLGGRLLAAGLVDEIVLYLAPGLIGRQARGLFDWPALTDLSQQHRLHWQDVRAVGDDLRIVARIR